MHQGAPRKRLHAPWYVTRLLAASIAAADADLDRELHHINPKGRPVKQCEHCRGARKSKSHHAKCDCGEKRDRRKDKGDAGGENSATGGLDGVSNHATGNGNRCQCHSGAKCICGMKKDSIDLKLDTSKHTLSLHATRAKPKLMSTQSESTLTVFTNGHHKPVHRNNLSAHISGAPYSIGRPHTLHGSAAFASYTQSHSSKAPESPPKRAMDTHSLSNNDYHTFLGSAQRPLNGMPVTPLTGSLNPSTYQDSLFTYGRDKNSPTETPIDAFSQQWPWNGAAASYSQNYGFGSLSTSPSQECLPHVDNDWALPSAGLNDPLWSAGDLPLDPSKLNDAMAQPISHSGESNKTSIGGLTTASSSHSEVGEPGIFGEMEMNKKAPSAASESLFWEDNPVFPYSSAQNNTLAATMMTPQYIEAAPPTKDILSTISSTTPAEKGALFPTTDLNELFGAVAMPTNMDAALLDNWATLDQPIYDGPDIFDVQYAQAWGYPASRPAHT